MVDPATINLDLQGKHLQIEKRDPPQLFDKLRDVIRTIPEEFKNFPGRTEEYVIRETS